LNILNFRITFISPWGKRSGAVKGCVGAVQEKDSVFAVRGFVYACEGMDSCAWAKGCVAVRDSGGGETDFVFLQGFEI